MSSASDGTVTSTEADVSAKAVCQFVTDPMRVMGASTLHSGHGRASSPASGFCSPQTAPVHDVALGDALALGDSGGDAEALGLTDADGLSDGLALGDSDKLGDAEALGLTDADGLSDRLALGDGDKLGDADALGLTEALGLSDGAAST